MTFYQELQLNQAGSKNLLRECTTTKDKAIHFLIYFFKILLTVAFCFVFVTLYSILFGPGNSAVGVVVLLFVMVFKNADFRVNTKASLGLLTLFYALMAFGPQLAHMAGPWLGLLINLGAMALIMVLGCHEPRMSNQSTIALGYLLVYGYEVEGGAYISRLAALAVGLGLTALVFWRHHRKQPCTTTLSEVVHSFDLNTLRSRWQLTVTLATGLAIFVAELFHMPRAMWAGIAAMSVSSLMLDATKARVKGRLIGNICGGIVFTILYFTLPDSLYANIGILGGIGVGFSVRYSWQAVFNTFGALALATTAFGLKEAVVLRVVQNAFGALLGLGLCLLVHHLAIKKQPVGA